MPKKLEKKKLKKVKKIREIEPKMANFRRFLIFGLSASLAEYSAE